MTPVVSDARREAAARMRELERRLGDSRAPRFNLLDRPVAVAVAEQPIERQHPVPREACAASRERTVCAPRVNVIQTMVAEAFGVTLERLLERSRRRDVVVARHVAIALTMRFLPSLSSTTVGRLFAGRDHTTVLHSRGAVERMVARDPVFASRVAALAEKIESALAARATGQ